MIKLNKNNALPLIFSALLSAVSLHTSAANSTKTVELNIEELRIPKATAAIPTVLNRLDIPVNQFRQQLSQAAEFKALNKLIKQHGQALWQAAVVSFKSANDSDDRPLYWARLKMSSALKQSASFNALSKIQQQQLLWSLELASRGQHDVEFNQNTSKKILITGFDPFFLDRNIDQSNPSGVAALALDNLVLNLKKGLKNVDAEIESLVVPVRFADFDQGMIETLLAPYFKAHDVDMIVTISMGRDEFDLEHFPGLRRSSKAPDNLNVYTGANENNPIIPRLGNKALKGPEFITFSLPVEAMLKAKGAFTINHNRNVILAARELSSDGSGDLVGQIAVEGSGGGYLSNEISYRSLLLRDQYHKDLPVGHIHTPRFKAFDGEKSAQIVKQIKAMLTEALTAI
ncbi:MAG: pyrrolidone-carboxylate peptidase [Phenylobacterium sp.]|jgi:pyrrolidone-carboxylate peptidase